ncbi:MAG: hypothetical protein RIG84_04535 [Roseovarius sp.]
MTTLSSGQLAAVLSLASLLSACSALDPAGLIAASRLDPLATPPSEIAVAVGVPEGLRLEDGDAEFRLAFRGGSAAQVVQLEERADLEIRRAQGEGPAPNTPGEAIYIAQIAPEDVPRIAALQREIRALREGGTEGEGTLAVSVVGGCYTTATPPPITVSTWLQTNPADGFVALTRQQDIARAIGAEEAALMRGQLARCAG